jgi:hypothetical protein
MNHQIDPGEDSDEWTLCESTQGELHQLWSALNTSLTLDEFKDVLAQQKQKRTWTTMFHNTWWWIQTFGFVGSQISTLANVRLAICLITEYLL